jgi:hypothetical protein
MGSYDSNPLGKLYRWHIAAGKIVIQEVNKGEEDGCERIKS